MTPLTPFWSDMLRYFVFGQAFMLLMLIIVVTARYSFKLSVTKAREGALPWHIVLIGASYVAWALIAIFGVRERLGLDMTWRTPAALFAATAGNAAMIFMLLHLSVQRIIVAALIGKMASRLQDDIDELKTATTAAAEQATAAAKKAEAAATTGAQTHAAVSQIKERLENGG